MLKFILSLMLLCTFSLSYATDTPAKEKPNYGDILQKDWSYAWTTVMKSEPPSINWAPIMEAMNGLDPKTGLTYVLKIQMVLSTFDPPTINAFAKNLESNLKSGSTHEEAIAKAYASYEENKKPSQPTNK